MAASMFEVVGTVKGDGDIPITKCRSTRTGLTVCIAEVEGPLVNGYFCLATEAHDDDGLPHTLEHLVFMGSEDYPYKGVLDLLANRCLASGTNAWTDTDHTCYTMTNAGSQGFLQLLPIYMDHILYPTLTESSYITEVHHINEDGENAGVVYCEMQARENEGESRTHLEMIRAMYPGHCGYRSETGGIMKNLRESTSHKKVCDYHHEFYRPENLCLVITGQIKAEEVFKALQPIEEKILSKGSRGEFTRPWQSPVPPLEGSTEQVVKYAADEESHGIVCVAWRGPPAQDPYQFASADLLLDYLTDSAISPLQKEFVECEEPYCSNVHGYTIENSESTLYFKFDNVVKEKLDMIHPILTGVLKRLSSGGEKLDMTRISNLIHRKILEGLSSLEDNPHNKMAAYLIGDFLFSKTQEHMEQRVKIVELYTKMKAEPESFWLALLNKYFIDKHHTVILGEPSISLMKEMGEEEAERVTAQQDSLGKDGLEKMASRLQHATEENEKEAPDSLLTSVNIPDVSSIHFHPISPYSNRLVPTQQGDHAHKSGSPTHPAFPLDKIPFRFQLDDIHSNFVQMNVLLDSSRIPQNLKYYLPLYCEVLFESQIQRDGVTVSHEDVISQLEADTLATGACLGVNGSRFSCGNYPQLVHIKIQVEREKYEKGVQWLHEILYDTQFTAERLKTVAKKMNNEISKYKRKGNAVLRALIRGILFTSDCNHQTNSMLKQNKFLDNVLADLDKDPKKVEENMEELRRLLTRQNNITVHVATNVDKLTAGGYQPQTPWKNLVAKHAQTDMDSLPIQQTSKYVLPLAEAKHLSVIVGVGSVESAYLIQTVPCVDSFDHPDLAAINIFIQCLTQLEGPMWRQIRGLGLAYHYSMYTAPETGSMYLLLARATHIVSAFKEARDIVMGYVNGSAEFSEIELETAKSSLTFEIIEKETTVADVTTQSMLAYLRNVPYTYNRDSLKSVSKVTMEDMKRVGKKYIASLFEENQVRRAICCNPSKVTEVVSGFAELGVTLETLPSLDNSSLCELD